MVTMPTNALASWVGGEGRVTINDCMAGPDIVTTNDCTLSDRGQSLVGISCTSHQSGLCLASCCLLVQYAPAVRKGSWCLRNACSGKLHWMVIDAVLWCQLVSRKVPTV